MHCKKCIQVLYVGETKTTLYKRHVQNFSRINNRKTLDDLTKHFTQDDHNLQDYEIIGIEKIYKEDSYRKTRE